MHEISILKLIFCQNFSVTQVEIGSVGSWSPSQETITAGVFKGERVAIKRISKKKVSENVELRPI